MVISIIAILVGLIQPSLGKTRGLTREVQCRSNLRQIAIGATTYAQDYRTHAPLAAAHELGGPQGRVSDSDSWLPQKMFGGSLAAELRPLNRYLTSQAVFRSPCDRGEPLWWFDTQPYQATATAYELYGSSYFYMSGYNRQGGVAMPMGLAKFVGPENFQGSALSLGQTCSLGFYKLPTRKVLVAGIPIHRTMSGVVAPSLRAQWYRPDPEHLWSNSAFLDGHVALVNVFPYEPAYLSVMTPADSRNPYY